MIRNYRVFSLLLLLPLLLLAACGRGEDIAGQGRGQAALAEAIKQRLAAMDKGETLALADVMPFEWDTVHLFGGYTSGTQVNEVLGYSWARPKSYVGEFETLLIFTQEGKVVQYCLAFQTLRAGGTFARDDARFTVQESNGFKDFVVTP